MAKCLLAGYWGASVLIGVLLLATTTQAQVETINVVYQAPSSCPSVDRFEAEIGARSVRVRITKTNNGARLFRATIGEADGGFDGQLTTSMDGVEDDPRRVRDLKCVDVSSALALMIAVDVDPRASTGPVSALALPLPVPTVVLPAPAIFVAEAPAVSPPAVAPKRPSWTWSAGTDLFTIAGTAPNLSLGAHVFAEGLRKDSAGGNSAFRFSLGYADSEPLGGSAPQATMRWVGGRVDGCPFGVAFHPKLLFLPCLAFELGAQQAKGSAAPIPQSQTRWASSVGAGARIQWSPVGSLFLEAGTGLWFPLLRRTYVFEHPRQIAYEMPWIGWSATVGGGVRFL